MANHAFVENSPLSSKPNHICHSATVIAGLLVDDDAGTYRMVVAATKQSRTFQRTKCRSMESGVTQTRLCDAFLCRRRNAATHRTTVMTGFAFLHLFFRFSFGFVSLRLGRRGVIL